MVKWLLKEGGGSIGEANIGVFTASAGHLETVKWILKH
jgi:hypothetical protein